jgi:hypothetical protein
MARSPLINVVADLVDERLRAHGFSRHGKTWYATNELGDYAIVDLPVMPRLPGMERFLVETGIVPAPWWSCSLTLIPRSGRESRRPGIGDALMRDRIDAPNGGPAGLGWTVANRDEAARTGTLVGDLLTAGPIQQLVAMLDRGRLHAVLSERNERTPGTDVVFAAESGPSAELDELLARFTEWKPDSDEFVAWAKAYAERARS